METSILNEFIVLEETNSFSKAAKRLRMSQATLSRHIMQLENELDVVLFERTTQKMKLTPYGKSLLQYAKDILESERSLKRNIEKIKFESDSHLNIGTIDFPFYYGITSQLAAFKQQYPSAILDVKIDSTDELLRQLKCGQLDLAFIRNIDDVATSFDSFLYAIDHMYIAVPATHPMANKTSATLKDFKNDYFHKRYAKNSLMENLFNTMTTDAGFIPKISTSEAEWEDSIINDLNSVTTCSGGLAETFRGNIHVKVLDIEPTYDIDIHLIKAPNNKSSKLTEIFFEFIAQQLKSQLH